MNLGGTASDFALKLVEIPILGRFLFSEFGNFAVKYLILMKNVVVYGKNIVVLLPVFGKTVVKNNENPMIFARKTCDYFKNRQIIKYYYRHSALKSHKKEQR